MNLFVGANAADDLGGLFGIGTTVGKQIGCTQHGLCGGEADLGAELDDQQVHQERDEALDCSRDFGHSAGRRIGT